VIKEARVILIVEHKVRDYDSWKQVFDEHETVRRQHGSTGHLLYRGTDDPNLVTLVVQFPSRESVNAFLDDPTLGPAMERGGVESEPRITFAHEAETADYTKARAA
jgi:hypothetical protein